MIFNIRTVRLDWIIVCAGWCMMLGWLALGLLGLLP